MPKCQTFNDEQINSFRIAGEVLRGCLDLMQERVDIGVTTKQLDKWAEEFIRSHDGCTPAFKGYHNYPATLCTSVNEECVHGIPSDRILNEGDIVSTDCGVLLNGLYTDACVTIPVGPISDQAQHLLKVTKGALDGVVHLVQAGVKTGDLSHYIQQYAETNNLSAVRSLTGHGLGETLHQYPDIPNVGTKGTGAKLPAGTVVAIEPIFSCGSDRVIEAPDSWTMIATDHALTAHFEHTILVTEDGCEVLA